MCRLDAVMFCHVRDCGLAVRTGSMCGGSGWLILPVGWLRWPRLKEDRYFCPSCAEALEASLITAARVAPKGLGPDPCCVLSAIADKRRLEGMSS
jgi:hypothetical protein